MSMEHLPVFVKAFLSLAFLAILGLFVRLYNALVRNPKRIRSILRKQGIDGPPPTFLLGNLREIRKAVSRKSKAPTKEAPTYHNCADFIFPFFKQWRSQYGTPHTFHGYLIIPFIRMDFQYFLGYMI